MPESPIAAARRLADEILFPTALETDAADVVPRSHLDELAAAGLYGLAGPRETGGLGIDFPTACEVIETLASGCLTTTFIFAQHMGPVLLLSSRDEDDPLRREFLAKLCSGEVRAGIALSAFRRDRPFVRAIADGDGWVFDGVAPWVTGWGRSDILLTSALGDDGTLVRAFIDASETPTVSAERLRLVGANASSTVRLTFSGHRVSRERIAGEDPYVAPPAHDGGGRLNGSLSLGVARRCCALIGGSALDGELEERRHQLDSATEETMAEARAAATELASRAAAALVVHTGSSALLANHHAQRLAREATFLLTFGTRAAIRAGLLRRLTSAGD